MFSDCEPAVPRYAAGCLRCARVATVDSGTVVNHAVRPSGESNVVHPTNDISRVNVEGRLTANVSEDTGETERGLA